MAGYGTKESDIRVWQTGCESVSASAFKVGEGLTLDGVDVGRVVLRVQMLDRCC